MVHAQLKTAFNYAKDQSQNIIVQVLVLCFMVAILSAQQHYLDKDGNPNAYKSANPATLAMSCFALVYVGLRPICDKYAVGKYAVGKDICGAVDEYLAEPFYLSLGLLYVGVGANYVQSTGYQLFVGIMLLIVGSAMVALGCPEVEQLQTPPPRYITEAVPYTGTTPPRTLDQELAAAEYFSQKAARINTLF